MIRIIINGCSGRMGRNLAAAAQEDSAQYNVVAGVDVSLQGEYPFPVYTTLAQCPHPADVVVDFTRPDALSAVLDYCVAHHTAAVIATTGLQAQHQAMVEQAAKQVPILQAANLSLGVNLLQELVQQSAAFLGDDFDIEIAETHHNQKIDSPSGTALALAESARRGQHTPHYLQFGRHSTNAKRQPGEIGMHALRGGTVVGTHHVYFYGTDETVELTHQAQARSLFARGALRAAGFVAGLQPGLYTMRDLLLSAEIVTQLHVALDQALVMVSGVPADFEHTAAVFDAVSHINLDMINHNKTQEGLCSLSFTCGVEAAQEARQAVSRVTDAWHTAEIQLVSPAVKLTLEGRGMPLYSGIAAKGFRALADAGVQVISVTTSETKISCLISPEDLPAAETALRQIFGLQSQG